MSRARADELWNSYQIRGREKYERDAAYHYQLDVLRYTLNHLAVVLDNEGIPEDRADRILRSVLYGTPNAADADQRIRDHEWIAGAISRMAPDISSMLEQLGLPPMETEDEDDGR